MLIPREGLDPERILLYGGPGAGKTFAWLMIAHWYQAQGNPSTFFIVDTDKAVGRMLATDFAHLRNVEYGVALDWAGCRDFLKKYHAAAQAGDWLIVDMLGPQTWQYVRNHFNAYTNEAAQDDFDLDDYLLELRKKAGKTKQPINEVSGWDWNIVNRMYLTWVNTFALRGDYHVLATAGSEKIHEKDDKATKVLFAANNQKVKGQKDAAHLFHTVLHVESYRPGEPHFTTMKDRGRGVLDGDVIKDFAIQYLCARAGWRMA